MDNSKIELKSTPSGLLSSEIEIEPKTTVSPAGKPGVGGLPGIPDLVVGALSGGEFCSVWTYASLCQPADYNDLSGPMIPSWCKLWSGGPYCNNEPVVPDESGAYLPENMCFNAQWQKVKCYTSVVRLTNVYVMKTGKSWVDGEENLDNFSTLNLPANDYYLCKAKDGPIVNCDVPGNIAGYDPDIRIGSPFAGTDKCVLEFSSWAKTRLLGSCPMMVIDVIPQSDTGVSMPLYSFDRYMRILDPETSLPIEDENYQGGYPVAVVPPEPEKDPFDPTMPTVPEEHDECGIICECIGKVVTALGAVNKTLLKIDSSVLSVIDSIEKKVVEIPDFVFDTKPITDKLNDILKSIDEISVEVTKEAGTNFWDVLGGAFKDIFDLIEFLIEKIIYLVVPEDTSNMLAAFDSLNDLISEKMKPAEQVKTAINDSILVEPKTFEDIYVDLPQYGRVKFFESEYVLIALPYVKKILSAIMILLTAFWAYRKVSSEMIK